MRTSSFFASIWSLVSNCSALLRLREAASFMFLDRLEAGHVVVVNRRLLSIRGTNIDYFIRRLQRRQCAQASPIHAERTPYEYSPIIDRRTIPQSFSIALKLLPTSRANTLVESLDQVDSGIGPPGRSQTTPPTDPYEPN